MVKECLSIDQIKELAKVTNDLFKHYAQLRIKYEIANNIKNPIIPEPLSVSLAIHLIRRGKILKKLSKWEVQTGGNIADVIAKKSGMLKKIEIKATGQSEFQGFTLKDLKADYLVWVNFGDVFLQKNLYNKKISIYTIHVPIKYWSKEISRNRIIKLTLNQFKQRTGRNCNKIEINLNRF